MDIYRSHVLVCGGTGCHSGGSSDILLQMEKELKTLKLDKEVKVVKTGCFGLCEVGPIVIVYPEGTFYSRVSAKDAKEIVNEHLHKGRKVERLIYKENDDKIEKSPDNIGFYKYQKRIALRNCGVIDPEKIDEYIATDGYKALGTVLTENKPQDVIDILKASGLRGRGGAGFPTGLKLQFCADEIGRAHV